MDGFQDKGDSLMASPYFSKINLHQQDFSVLQNAGRAWGEAYQQAGAAIGQLGSAYFKRQGMMNQAEQFAKSEMGQEYLRGQGMPQDELDKIAEDPKAATKLVYDASREAGGIDKLMAQMQAEYSFGRLKEVDAMKDELHKQEKIRNFYLIKDLKSKDKLQAQTMAYYKHLNTENENGVFNRDADDPTGGFDVSSPEAMQAVMAVNEQMGLGVHNPAILGMMSDSLAPVDEITGEQLPYANFASEADMHKAIDTLFASSPLGRRLPPEKRNAFVERMKGNIDGAGDKPFARDIFKSELKASGFGAFAEAMKTNVGTMGNFRSLLDESLVTLDDGTVDIKNPVAASVALMQLARMAQGAGVLSNQDVNLIKGDQTLAASWERLISKNIGESTELTEEMIAQNPAWQNSINPETGEVFQVGDEVTLGGANLSAADMKMFQSLADKLDDRSNQFVKKVIPDIYKNVRATYGGFTIDQLNQFTDLHQYMPNGIVNLNPMSQVTTKQMDAVVNMMKDGMTESEAKNFIRQNSMSDPNTEYDEDTDGKAIDAMVDSVYNKGYRSRHNAHVQTYNDQAQYQGGKRRVDPPKKDIDTSKVVTDSDGNLVDAVGGAMSTYGALDAAERIGKYSLKRDLIDKEFVGKNTWKSVQKDISKLKGKALIDNARNFGVEGFDKMSDKQIRAAIKKNIGDEVKKIAAKEMAEMGIKKSLWSKLLVSGGVGAVLFAYDIVDLLGTKDKVTVKAAEDLAKKYPKGSPERKVADEIVNEAKSQFSTIADGLRGIGAGLLEENNVGKNLEARRTAASKATSIRPAKPRNYLQKLLGTYN